MPAPSRAPTKAAPARSEAARTQGPASRPSGPTPARSPRPALGTSGLQPPPPTAARPPGRPHVSHGPGPPLLPTRRGASNLGHALPPLQPVRADPRPGSQLTTGDAGCWLRPGSEWARRRPGGATRRRRSRQRISRRGMTRPVRRSEMRRTEQHARGEARRREARRGDAALDGANSRAAQAAVLRRRLSPQGAPLPPPPLSRAPSAQYSAILRPRPAPSARHLPSRSSAPPSYAYLLSPHAPPFPSRFHFSQICAPKLGFNLPKLPFLQPTLPKPPTPHRASPDFLLGEAKGSVLLHFSLSFLPTYTSQYAITSHQRSSLMLIKSSIPFSIN